MKSAKLYKPRRAIVIRKPERRGPPRERGYGGKWETVSARHRRRFPVCIECERADIIVPVDLVDHKIPVALRPDLRLDPKNLWSLCRSCHEGMKTRMEAYAIRTGQVELLILWCDNPETRPCALTTSRRLVRREEMIV